MSTISAIFADAGHALRPCNQEDEVRGHSRMRSEVIGTEHSSSSQLPGKPTPISELGKRPGEESPAGAKAGTRQVQARPRPQGGRGGPEDMVHPSSEGLWGACEE
jgi:hypothetical protein